MIGCIKLVGRWGFSTKSNCSRYHKRSIDMIDFTFTYKGSVAFIQPYTMKAHQFLFCNIDFEDWQISNYGIVVGRQEAQDFNYAIHGSTILNVSVIDLDEEEVEGDN